jgi:hypothetical protein
MLLTKFQQSKNKHDKLSEFHSKKAHDSSTKYKWVSHTAKSIYHKEISKLDSIGKTLSLTDKKKIYKQSQYRAIKSAVSMGLDVR